MVNVGPINRQPPPYDETNRGQGGNYNKWHEQVRNHGQITAGAIRGAMDGELGFVMLRGKNTPGPSGTGQSYFAGHKCLRRAPNHALEGPASSLAPLALHQA